VSQSLNRKLILRCLAWMLVGIAVVYSARLNPTTKEGDITLSNHYSPSLLTDRIGVTPIPVKNLPKPTSRIDDRGILTIPSHLFENRRLPMYWINENGSVNADFTAFAGISGAEIEALQILVKETIRTIRQHESKNTTYYHTESGELKWFHVPKNPDPSIGEKFRKKLTAIVSDELLVSLMMKDKRLPVVVSYFGQKDRVFSFRSVEGGDEFTLYWGFGTSADDATKKLYQTLPENAPPWLVHIVQLASSPD
jgi:hypothetical protein